jgi:crossover junction endodeoxyribonuclease RuvC
MSRAMMFLGIDPGVSGGLAFLDERGGVLKTYKMPESEKDLLDIFEAANLGLHQVVACLERVSSSPQMGVVSAFTFGRGYGVLTMGLTAARIPFEFVGPKKWQAFHGCLTGGDKNVSKRRAQQLFPHISVTHATADALLLAEYCRRGSHLAGSTLDPPQKGTNGKASCTDKGKAARREEGERRSFPQGRDVTQARAAQSTVAGHGAGSAHQARSGVRVARGSTR